MVVAERHNLADEMETYLSLKPALLEEHRGEYALIHGQRLVGTYATRRDALRVGYHEVGAVPFLVQHIVEEEEERKHIVSDVLSHSQSAV